MKRKIVLTILCVIFLLEIFYLQFSREPTVLSSVTTSDSKGYDAALTITMNKIVIFNLEETKQDLINQILDNEFKNMQFSYDVMGYPDKWIITVYTNKLTKYLDIPAFHITYESDTEWM